MRAWPPRCSLSTKHGHGRDSRGEVDELLGNTILLYHEVFFLQPFYEAALLVGHHHVQRDGVYID